MAQGGVNVLKGKNPRKQIILSISILVSGREETVGKCLDSLETTAEQAHEIGIMR